MLLITLHLQDAVQCGCGEWNYLDTHVLASWIKMIAGSFFFNVVRHSQKEHALLFNHAVIYSEATDITLTEGFFMIPSAGTPRIARSILY